MTIKKTIPHIADDDERPICPDCGEPLSDQDLFLMRMHAITEVLETAPHHEITVMLAMLAGEHIGAYIAPKARTISRSDFLDILDETIKSVVAGWAQKKREAAIVKRHGSHSALMPDVSDSIN